MSVKETIRTIRVAVTKPQDSDLHAHLVARLTDFISQHSGDVNGQQVASRLDEDLRALYKDDLHTVLQRRPKSLAVFILVLRHLGPVLPVDSVRAYWLDQVVFPKCSQKVLPQPVFLDVRDLLKAALSRDEGAGGDERFRRKVLEEYLTGSNRQKGKDDTCAEEDGTEEDASDDGETTSQDRAWMNVLEQAIIGMSRIRAREFLTLVHVSYVKSITSRVQLQHLLALFLKQNGAYAHHILQTPLMNTLLISLQLDTSTTLLSLALNNLIMLMPSLAYAIIPYLPQLYAIFGRVICWDINIKQVRSEPDSDLSKPRFEEHILMKDLKWQVLHYTFDTAPSSVPDVTRFFTFLYGVYPCNILLFLRGPLDYLRKAKYQPLYEGPLEDFFDEEAIRARSLPLLRSHVIAPGIVTYNAETEFTDTSRWQQVEASDVASACTSLYVQSSPAKVLSQSSATISKTSSRSSEKLSPSAIDILSTYESLKGVSTTLEIDAGLRRPQNGMRSTIDRLEREVLLLRNELNFELYLNQQHVQHAARLRRDQITDQSIEAERLNLLNHNRTIQEHLELSEVNQEKTRKEMRELKTKHQKWETELSNRIKELEKIHKTQDINCQLYQEEIATLKARLVEQTQTVEDNIRLRFELENELSVIKPKHDNLLANEDKVRTLTKELINKLQGPNRSEVIEKHVELLSSNWQKLEMQSHSQMMHIEELQKKLIEKDARIQTLLNRAPEPAPSPPRLIPPSNELTRMRKEMKNLMETNAMMEEEVFRLRSQLSQEPSAVSSSSSSKSPSTGH